MDKLIVSDFWPVCDTCKLFDDFEGDCIQDFKPDIENYCKFYEEEE